MLASEVVVDKRKVNVHCIAPTEDLLVDRPRSPSLGGGAVGGCELHHIINTPRSGMQYR
jgi:hypothetical protein